MHDIDSAFGKGEVQPQPLDVAQHTPRIPPMVLVLETEHECRNLFYIYLLEL